MDTTEPNIKMCLKATEIQEAWEPKEYDIVYVPSNWVIPREGFADLGLSKLVVTSNISLLGSRYRTARTG